MTYIATPTLPYHLYADEWELLVLTASLTSASLSKNKFFDRLTEVKEAVKTSNSHSSAYRWYGRAGVAM